MVILHWKGIYTRLTQFDRFEILTSKPLRYPNSDLKKISPAKAVRSTTRPCTRKRKFFTESLFLLILILLGLTSVPSVLTLHFYILESWLLGEWLCSTYLYLLSLSLSLRSKLINYNQIVLYTSWHTHSYVSTSVRLCVTSRMYENVLDCTYILMEILFLIPKVVNDFLQQRKSRKSQKSEKIFDRDPTSRTWPKE